MSGANSITQLVQALQAGSISKQELYANLTNMYKGQTPIQSNNNSLLGTPSTANSSFNTSFSLHTSVPPTPQQPQFVSAAAPQSYPVPAQQQQAYQSVLSQPPQQMNQFTQPAAAAAPAPVQPSSVLYSAQAQAAQQHIQSFLSKHLNNTNLSNSLNQSGNSSLNLSLTNTSISGFQPSLQQAPSAHAQLQQAAAANSSLNLSSVNHSLSIHPSIASAPTVHQQSFQQAHPSQQQFNQSLSHHQVPPTQYQQQTPQQQFQQQLTQQLHQQPAPTQPFNPNSSFDQSQYGGRGNQSNAAFFSPAQNAYPDRGGRGTAFSPGSNLSGLDSYQNNEPLSAMEDSMAHSQGGPNYHDEPDGEAEEYDANQRYSARGASSQRNTHRSSGGGAGSAYQSSRRSAGSARQSVRERMAAVYTDEKNKELTFKPAINPMPRSLYGKKAEAADEAPFLGRVMHWHENKKARERQMSAELEKKALAECSFKPAITPESVAIVEAPGASHRRLFSARSTARAKILELEVKRKEEEAFRQNCTFEPALNKKSLHMASTVSQRRPLTAAPAPPPLKILGIASNDRDLKECTFTPKTNAVPSNMLAASLYLEQNAFERLASTQPASDRGYDSDGTSPISRGRGRDKNRPASAGGKRSSSSDARSSPKSPGASDSQDAAFTEFLARLKYKEFQRAEKLQQLKVEEQKQYQYGRPMLSKKSAQLVKKSMEAGRYLSPEKHASAVASQKAASSTQLVISGNQTPAEQLALASRVDPECTFTPTINPYSQNLSRRSVHEMSSLELLRRSHNLELKQNQLMQAEMEEASFTPHLISNKSKHGSKYSSVDSRLKVASEPDLFLERLEFQRKLREAELERQKKIRDEEEIKDCTFTPAVHESPAFVQRIARSMEVTRGIEVAQAAKIKKGKPDWK